MITSRTEAPPPLPRSVQTRTGRQDCDARHAPAFDDALREQAEPVAAAPEEAPQDPPDATDNAAAQNPSALDLLIAQMLPQQAPAPSSEDRAPPRSADQKLAQSGPVAVREPSPDMAAKALPIDAELAFSATPDVRVLGTVRDSDLRVEAGVPAEPSLAPEPAPRAASIQTGDAEDAVQRAVPAVASAGDTVETPGRARRIDKARTTAQVGRDPSIRADVVADRFLANKEAPVAATPPPVRQQPDASSIQLDSGSKDSTQKAPAIDPVRGRHARPDAPATLETRRVVLGQVEASNHFAIAADPVRQIASEVTRAFETPSIAAAPEPRQDAVKTISVQLEPESLGEVTLRMRLSGSALQVRVDVAEPATLDLIQRERDRLQKSMTSDHVSIERLEIRAAGGPAPVQGGDNASAPKQDMNAPGQQQKQNAASQGGEPRRESRGDSRPGDALRNGPNNETARGNVSRGVYL